MNVINVTEIYTWNWLKWQILLYIFYHNEKINTVIYQNYWLIHFKWVNCMVFELYLNKDVKKEKTLEVYYVYDYIKKMYERKRFVSKF